MGRLSREAGGLGEYGNDANDNQEDQPELPTEWPGDLTSVIEPDEPAEPEDEATE